MTTFTHELKITCGRDIPDGGHVTDNMLHDYLAVVSASIDCYTLQHFQGVWKGTPEDSFSISVLVDDSTQRLTEVGLKTLARIYKEDFKQDSVLYTVTPVNHAEFI